MLFKSAQKRTNYWSKIRKKAPKVPDITCPDIDKVLDIIDKGYTVDPFWTFLGESGIRFKGFGGIKSIQW